MADSLQGLGTPQSVGFPVTLGCMCNGDPPSSNLTECADYQVGVPAYNFYAAATVDDPANPCYPIIFGCTNPLADNFILLIPDVQVDVNTDDGSCVVAGCTDSTAFNYDPTATVNDGSCYPIIIGCLDATTTPVSWAQYGCVDNGFNNCDEYFNYIQTPNANTQGTCTPNVPGCMDGPHPNGTVDGCGYGVNRACNYDAAATITNYQCTYAAFGCTDPDSCDYDASADTEYVPSTCTYCDDNTADNYDAAATCNSGCEYCDTPNGFALQGNHTTNTTIRLRWFNNSDAAVVSYTVFWSNDNFSTTSTRVITGNGNGVTGFGVSGSPVKIDVGTLTPLLTGTTYEFYVETNCSATNSAVTITKSGTTTATYGCTDNGSSYTSGSTNPAGGTHAACNYSALANFDDGTCEFTSCYGCTIQSACNYGGVGITVDDGVTCEWHTCVVGCTDPTDCAYNYNCAELPATPLAGQYAGIPNAVLSDTCGPSADGCSGVAQLTNYAGCFCASSNQNQVSTNTPWGGYISEIDVTIPGCTDNSGTSYTGDVSGLPFTVPFYSNFDATATCNDGCIPCEQFCGDSTANNYQAATSTGNALNNPIPICSNENLCCFGSTGCTDPTATNYNLSITPACSDNSLCVGYIYGCIDNGYLNNVGGTQHQIMINQGFASAFDYWNGQQYNSYAGNGCIPFYGAGNYPTTGALSYYAGANFDDGSCVYIEGCMDAAQSSTAGYTDVNGFCPSGTVGNGTTYGCTDMTTPESGYEHSNYNPCADIDTIGCIL